MLIKILDNYKFFTYTALDTKAREVENKISDVSSLVTTSTLYSTSTFFTSTLTSISTAEFNRFFGTMYDDRLKQSKLATKSICDTVLQHDNKITNV